LPTRARKNGETEELDYAFHEKNKLNYSIEKCANLIITRRATPKSHWDQKVKRTPQHSKFTDRESLNYLKNPDLNKERRKAEKR